MKEESEKKDDYEDIIFLPYPFPSDRKRMGKEERAAQFSPFAALKGNQNKEDEEE